MKGSTLQGIIEYEKYSPISNSNILLWNGRILNYLFYMVSN